jgi:hypothetical protein
VKKNKATLKVKVVVVVEKTKNVFGKATLKVKVFLLSFVY